jgi:hypothetical protein
MCRPIAICNHNLQSCRDLVSYFVLANMFLLCQRLPYVDLSILIPVPSVKRQICMLDLLK